MQRPRLVTTGLLYVTLGLKPMQTLYQLSPGWSSFLSHSPAFRCLFCIIYLLFITVCDTAQHKCAGHRKEFSPPMWVLGFELGLSGFAARTEPRSNAHLVLLLLGARRGSGSLLLIQPLGASMVQLGHSVPQGPFQQLQIPRVF